jgi:hypothetical protein
MASELINLNKARKAQGKIAQKAEAAQNRVRFGRSKAETTATKASAAKLRRALDDAKRDR